MGTISIAYLSVLALCVVVDTLLGLIRGRNRSLLRFGLVVASLVVSLLVYKPITDAVMNVKVEGYSISMSILEAFTSSSVALPESLLNLIIALVQIVLGVFVFIGVFLVIKFITWLVAFPILKIFVRREEKKNIGLGALVGFVQGLFVAIVICGCLSGFLTEFYKIAQVEIDGEKVVEMSDEFGIEEYCASPTAKFFDVTGGWVFDIVSTTTDASGNKVSVSSICNTTTTIVNVTGEITNAFAAMGNVEGSSTESIKEIGNAFITVGTAIENLDDDSKQLVGELLDAAKDLVASEYGELPEEIEAVFDSIDVDDLKIKSAGEALNAIAKYAEEGTITQDNVNDIVNGLADNMFVLDMLGIDGESLLEVDDINADMFRSAIENQNLTQEDINTLKNLFGLN